MTPWLDAIALWLADFYLAATILLVLAGAALCLIKQPARRMALAWGTLVSLLVAAVFCLLASRPRIDPRNSSLARNGRLSQSRQQNDKPLSRRFPRFRSRPSSPLPNSKSIRRTRRIQSRRPTLFPSLQSPSRIRPVPELIQERLLVTPSFYFSPVPS